MTIVCGTDFSDAAAQAVQVATALAQRLREPLELVHVVDDRGAELGRAADDAYAPRRARLREDAEALRALHGIHVDDRVLHGRPDEALVEVAQRSGARLIVIAALGSREKSSWLLGSVAERTAQSSPIPVLIVRSSSPFEAWARGERSLRVMVGTDLSFASKAAIRWLAALRQIGPCEVVVTHVAWPPAEHARLGVRGPMPLDSLRPEVEEALLRDLREWVGPVPGEGPVSFLVSPGMGRVHTHIGLLAQRHQVDLLVVGTHHRTAMDRLWHGSTSRGVIHVAPMSVACVPAAERPAEIAETALPTLRRILVPTDLSPLGNRAVPFAYALAARGGIVHLVHVAPAAIVAGAPDPTAQLEALTPLEAADRGVDTRIEIVNADDVGEAIHHAAERLGVDAVCMATHSRSGLSQRLLGSVTQRVLQACHRPVLVVPPPREA